MSVHQQPVTVEQFEAVITCPENANKAFELIGGEIVEKQPPVRYARYVAYIAGHIFMHLRQFNLGHLTWKTAGYHIADDRYLPDVAFTSYDRQPDPLDMSQYYLVSPDLAVEVMSADSPKNAQLLVKVANYLAVETTVWVVRPDKAVIQVFQPGQPVQAYHEGQRMTGGDVLLNFRLNVTKLFKS